MFDTASYLFERWGDRARAHGPRRAPLRRSHEHARQHARAPERLSDARSLLKRTRNCRRACCRSVRKSCRIEKRARSECWSSVPERSVRRHLTMWHAARRGARLAASNASTASAARALRGEAASRATGVASSWPAGASDASALARRLDWPSPSGFASAASFASAADQSCRQWLCVRAQSALRSSFPIKAGAP